MTPNEPKTSLRYETAGCLLTLFLSTGIIGGWFLTLVMGGSLLIAFFHWIELSDAFVAISIVVWLLVVGVALRAVVLRGLALYDRIMHRWFPDDHQEQVQ
jgi:uncharacterized protein YneF (UPF0154 family)